MCSSDLRAAGYRTPGSPQNLFQHITAMLFALNLKFGIDGGELSFQIGNVQPDCVRIHTISKNREEMKLSWLRQALEWQKDTNNPTEFLDALKVDLFINEVYVFTPTTSLTKQVFLITVGILISCSKSLTFLVEENFNKTISVFPAKEFVDSKFPFLFPDEKHFYGKSKWHCLQDSSTQIKLDKKHGVEIRSDGLCSPAYG